MSYITHLIPQNPPNHPPTPTQVKVGDQLDESGPNAFVGGKNRWTYDSFVNWEFWFPGFPILVYFKVCVSCVCGVWRCGLSVGVGVIGCGCDWLWV